MAPTIPDPARVRYSRQRRESPAHGESRSPQTGERGRPRDRARAATRGWSLKEFAEAAQRGERQLARWMDGTEHAQLDTLFAIESFRQPLIVALAERAGFGVDVHTTITIRRAA
jgi:hypothetical protein